VANAGSPGRARISRKTIARGRPVVTACTCGLRAFAQSFCAQAPGACGHPAFPAPSSCERDEMMQSSDDSRREKVDLCLCRHCERSEQCSATHATLDCFVASLLAMTTDAITMSPSSWRTPGPITPGLCSRDDRLPPSATDRIRGMGPGVRQDDDGSSPEPQLKPRAGSGTPAARTGARPARS
jgi:hypothetical protein